MRAIPRRAASPVLSWNTAPGEYDLILQIASRAVRAARKAGVEYRLQDATMDINAVHSNGTPLRLEELLEADNFNFNHDVFGIRRHLDRSTGQLGNCFVPRFAKLERASA